MTLRSKPAAALLALATLALTAYLDHRTGVEISFSIFYLLPVSIVAWHVGLWEGAFMAVACAATWYTMDSVMGQHRYGNSVAPYWNAAVRLGFFAFSAVTLAALRRALTEARSASRLRADMLRLLGREFKDCLGSMDRELEALREGNGDGDFPRRAREALERHRNILGQMAVSVTREIEKDPAASKDPA